MTTSRPSNPLNPQIRAEATEWLLRFSEEEVDAAGREEFSHWLRASPEHVRAYLRICAFWQEAGRIDGKDAGRDIAVLVERTKDESNVFLLEFGGQGNGVQEVTATTQSPKKRVYWAIAATVLLSVVGGAIAWFVAYANNTYRTEVGEQRIVNLSDGSTVIMNANSSMQVAYSEAQRLIDLRQGQALFKVAKNPGRPFIVRSGQTRIRAVGTQFDVNKKDNGITVTVVEGRVAVDPRVSLMQAADQTRRGGLGNTAAPVRQTRPGEVLVVAGEQLTLAGARPRDNVATPVPKSVRLTDATAWTSGLLVFDAAPLSEVIREFNRQNLKPMVLSGAELADLQISGTFPASGSDRILHFLRERFEVAVRETDDEIQISSSRTAGDSK